MAGVMQNGLINDQSTQFAVGDRVIDATPPETASDAAYEPLDEPLFGTIAGAPEGFTAHGVSTNDLGAFPGGARASQIVPDLANNQFAVPARARDGYGLQGPGTPELMQGLPKQGVILDKINSYGVIRLGVGPAIPVVLVAAIAAVVLWQQAHGGKLPAVPGLGS